MSDELKWVSTTNMFVLKDGKVLVLKRGEDEADFPGWYMLPGGKQEPNETPLQAAIRETFEETGIKVSHPTLKIIATHNHDYRSKIYLVYIFTATEFSGDIVQSTEGETLWIPLQELLTEPKLYPDLKRHIKMIEDMTETGEVVFTYHKFNQQLEIIETL